MRRKYLVHSAFCLLPSTLILLAGCEGNHLTQQGDPFLGMHAAPTPVTPSGSGAAATQTAGGGIPPLPGSIAVPSQAALASGTTQAPDNPRNLRMDAPVVPVRSPGGAARGVAPGNVQVEGPVPVPEATSNLAPVPIAQGGLQQTGGAARGAAVPPATPAANMTFEQAQQFLKQRGVVWQRLETWGDQGQWKFQCSLPIPGSSNINRTYETKAPLPQDPLSAVRAVLDTIEKDQR